MADDQHPVEIIMARGLITNLMTPAFLVDLEGTLIFFNEAAGEILGLSFEEAGRMTLQEWGTRFDPVAEDGTPASPERLPLAIALREARPAHGELRIRSAVGDERQIEVGAFPIVGREGLRGALAIFSG